MVVQSKIVVNHQNKEYPVVEISNETELVVVADTFERDIFGDVLRSPNIPERAPRERLRSELALPTVCDNIDPSKRTERGDAFQERVLL